MFHHQFIMRISIAAAIALTLAALSRATRAQELVVQDDPVLIEGGTADFGDVPHALGNPVNNGKVRWRFSTVNGSLQVSAEVIGTLFLDSFDPGCVRLTILYKSGSGLDLNSGTVLAARNKDLCVTTSGDANKSTNQLRVTDSFKSGTLNQVLLQTHSVVNGADVRSSLILAYNAPNAKKNNVNINGDNADFGNGLHAGGGPTGNGLVQFTRDNGSLKGLVSGTLYYDSLFSEGCAQIIIDFQSSSGTNLNTKTIKKCGPGGNANDNVNKKAVDETFSSGSLFKIRLRVGQVLPDGSFVRVKSKTCDFATCN